MASIYSISQTNDEAPDATHGDAHVRGVREAHGGGVSQEAREAGAWRRELARAYRTVGDLVTAGFIAPDDAATLNGIAGAYQISVPQYYADLIDPGLGTRCPIYRQAIPTFAEQDPALPAWARAWSQDVFGREVPWHPDPIGDITRLAAPRLTHRYGNRALMHVSAACALYCRFCFRKSHLNDEQRTLYDGSLDPALAYLAAHPEVTELVLTGGDPLALADAWWEKFLRKVAAIGHIRQVRIHSRMAVTLPSRLTAHLGALLAAQPFAVALVSHFNHPRELTRYARGQLGAMRKRGIVLYNQAVLMRGVNDTVDTLRELHEELYYAGVTPFYLHHPDWTPGTFHFRVAIAHGQALMRELAGRIAGPAMPQYVLDTPGGGGKVNLLWVEPEDERADGNLGGALYLMALPTTRFSPSPPMRYLDLHFKNGDVASF